MNNLLKRIDPFEVLYLAVALATFNHTTWAGAFLFEGAAPTGSLEVALWYFKGALLATAIDVGMYTTSKSLVEARGFSIFMLVLAFTIAAAGSFYTQLVYILSHTPQYTISEGVSSFWSLKLSPLTDARVILLPAMLPLLAIVYTLARIFRHKDEAKREQEAWERNTITVDSSSRLVEIVKEQPELLEATERLALPAGSEVDWEGKRFWDSDEGKWRGPYKTKRTLMSQMKALETRRRRKSEREAKGKQ